jgi:hypothetical protein
MNARDLEPLQAGIRTVPQIEALIGLVNFAMLQCRNNHRKSDSCPAHACVQAIKNPRSAKAEQGRISAAMAYQVPVLMAARAALPLSGILLSSPRLLARSLAIRARALALRRASIC